MKWIKEVVKEEEKNICPEDLDIFYLVDDAKEAVEHINNFYSKYILRPNF